MRTRDAILLLAVSALALLPGARHAHATDFYVYNVTLKLVAEMVVVGMEADVIVKRKLGNADIINLALGRPLGTKIDKNTEVLAGAGTYLSDAAESKLIVFDPSQNGVAQIKAVVGTLSTLDIDAAYLASKSQGSGIGSGVLATTTLGNPAQNGFLTSTFNGVGSGSGTHDPFGGNSKVSGKGTGSGRLRFNFTDGGGTQLFDGIVVKAEGKVSGKPIGGFTQ